MLLALRDNQHSHFTLTALVTLTLTVMLTSTGVLLAPWVAIQTISVDLNLPRHITPDSRLDMASNKRTASQTEDGGPIVKRRKMSGRNAYVAFLHFFGGILKSLQEQEEEEEEEEDVSIPRPSCRIAQQGLRVRYRRQRHHANLSKRDQ
jgi:hypothetical protein